MYVVLCATVMLWAAQSQAQEPRVLLLAYDETEALAQGLRQHNPALEITQAPLGFEAIDPELLMQHDVVITWTNQRPPGDQAQLLGDALADYVDAGGGVIEMVYGNTEGDLLIAGRWREGDYACVTAATEGADLAGDLGPAVDGDHVLSGSASSFGSPGPRTGNSQLREGAHEVTRYRDGQILLAVRDQGPGAVAWLGFYPGDPDDLSGDWASLMGDTIYWTAQILRDDGPGHIYRVPEGTQRLTLSAPGPQDPEASYNWDLDGDGGFGEASGYQVEINTASVDGPRDLRAGLLVVRGSQTQRYTVRVVVLNQPPAWRSQPPQVVAPNEEMVYTLEVEDPAQELDTVTVELLQGPQGAWLEGGVLRWAAQGASQGQEVEFILEARDEEGAASQQRWTLTVDRAGRDGDGVPDVDDNCPDLSNADQADLDNDGLGDACDADIDGDGLDAAQEAAQGTDPRRADSDSDGLDDGEEVERGTHPRQVDSDQDGVSDGDEVANRTNPLDEDTDGDTLDDGTERSLGTNPREADTDGDGLDDAKEQRLGTDPLDKDTDGDGVSDGREAERNSNPLAPPEETGESGCQSAPGLGGGLYGWWWVLAMALGLRWRPQRGGRQP
jgi:hypothetical protein